MNGLIVVLVLGILLLSYRSNLFQNGSYGLDITTSYMKRTVTSVPLANNPIIQENKLPGSTSWQPAKPAPYNGQRFPDIEGYALSSSAIAGDTVYFAVSTNTATFQADLYRLGYYQGKGGRFIEAIRATVGANFPGHAYAMPTMDKQTGLVEADWPVAFKIHIDRSWVTGIYLVKLTNQAGYQGYIPFVIRSQRVAPLIFLHADITEQAYNPWGGKSLYAYNSTAHMRAYKVSYNRPLAIEGNPGYGLVLLWEYPMIRYLEEQGYDLSYLSMADIAPGSPAIRGAKGILIVGHNEYWSKDMRDTIEQAVSHGVNLANFAADTMYTQIRYEPSINGSMPNRTIVCYRDTTLDPVADRTQVTVNFRDAPVNRPEQTLLGTMYRSYFSTPASGFSWVVNDPSSWIFAGTEAKRGDKAVGIVGYEYDTLSSAYPAPPGDTIVGSSPVVGISGYQENAESTVYTAASGARVFSAGTLQWSWGLDEYGSKLRGNTTSFVSLLIQKVTDNILHVFEGS